VTTLVESAEERAWRKVIRIAIDLESALSLGRFPCASASSLKEHDADLTACA
jgi:hypothetical protein